MAPKSRKLHPPTEGPTRLYREDRLLYEEDKRRQQAPTVAYGRLDDEQGRGGQLSLLEGSCELIVCYDRDGDGNELPYQKKLTELLGPVLSADGEEYRGISPEVRNRVRVLVAQTDGDLAKLRYLLAGGQGYVRTYPSERAYVAANPAARCFPQMDFGFGWREAGCYYRVGFVPESGEVIANLRGFDPYDRTELLGQVQDREQLEQLLKPLWRLAPTKESLARVRGALQTLPKRAPSRARLSPLAA